MRHTEDGLVRSSLAGAIRQTAPTRTQEATNRDKLIVIMSLSSIWTRNLSTGQPRSICSSELLPYLESQTIQPSCEGSWGRSGERASRGEKECAEKY